MLIETLPGVLTDSDIETVAPLTPEDVNEVGLPRNPDMMAKKGSWLRGLDLNQRPLGYEPNELPDCSTPQRNYI